MGVKAKGTRGVWYVKALAPEERPGGKRSPWPSWSWFMALLPGQVEAPYGDRMPHFLLEPCTGFVTGKYLIQTRIVYSSKSLVLIKT